MRVKGKVIQWDDAKGFGFVQPMLKGERVFLHINALQQRSRRPLLGDVVTYTVSKDKDGRKQAAQVTYAGEKLRIKAANKSSALPLVLVCIFFILLSLAIYLEKTTVYILPYYLVLSCFTFLTYLRDKHSAQAGRWRVSESTLQILALVGGWPGALLAQNYLRHKSKKRQFLLVFWLAVIVNVLLLTQLKYLNLII